MTRYEKLKPGIAFLNGDSSVKTLEDAIATVRDFIECWNCPVRELCPNEEACEDKIRAYLKEEIE